MAATSAARWTFDDIIAYTLAAFPRQAMSVLTRIRDAPDAELLAGDEVLCIRVVHTMADWEELATIDEAVRAYYGKDVERLEDACLDFESDEGAHPPVELPRPLRTLWAGRAMARVLDRDKLSRRARRLLEELPPQLVRAAAAQIRSPRAVRTLVAAADKPATVACAASLLARLDSAWRPGWCLHLAGADFEGVCWPGVVLRRADLRGANLCSANFRGGDLEECDLTVARAGGARFSRARLRGARCDHLRAEGADFTRARMSEVKLTGAHLVEARFRSARLRGAQLGHAMLDGADFSGADLSGAYLAGASLDKADFTRAVLQGAGLVAADLRTARLDAADVAAAELTGAKLEGVVAGGLFADRADFSHALLTRASFPGAEMSCATFRGAGLAHVELEGADLRAADFTHASFHLGSSRSGLVGSVIAGEGSRTGFYTDDFDDRSYKAPEAIRKANLCSADLRGAVVEDCDFYLVDLRGARYDPDQGAHFRRCGAIL